MARSLNLNSADHELFQKYFNDSLDDWNLKIQNLLILNPVNSTILGQVSKLNYPRGRKYKREEN